MTIPRHTSVAVERISLVRHSNGQMTMQFHSFNGKIVYVGMITATDLFNFAAHVLKEMPPMGRA